MNRIRASNEGYVSAKAKVIAPRMILKRRIITQLAAIEHLLELEGSLRPLMDEDPFVPLELVDALALCPS